MNALVYESVLRVLAPLEAWQDAETFVKVRGAWEQLGVTVLSSGVFVCFKAPFGTSAMVAERDGEISLEFMSTFRF